MIFPAVVLASLLASISAQQSCVNPLGSYFTCTTALQKDCPPGKTLFDMLDPQELCEASITVGGQETTCGAGLATVTKQLDAQGCCTLTSLYPTMASFPDSGNCSTSEKLSYEGFSQVVSYFCETQEYESADFYCLTDGKALLETVGPVMKLALYTNQSDPTAATQIFNSVVDCAQIAATQCCYPSLKEFIEGCGDEEAKEQLDALNLFLLAAPMACNDFQHVTLDFSSICPDLTPIDNCFASSDDNCLGDDDAAFSVMPAFASVFAAIAGFLFFARQL